MAKEKSEFTVRVIAAIRKIPKGKVATYSQVASLAGKPNAARGVVWILHSSSSKEGLPWHRVLNSKGRISFPEGSLEYRTQRKLLEKEGVEFSPEGDIDLPSFQWKKKPPSRKPRKGPTLFS